MPWQNNSVGGIYLNGTSYPLQKRYEIVQSFINTGSISESAQDNQVWYGTANKIISGFLATGSCEARKGGNRTGRKMEDWITAYLEALVLTKPWLYLEEIRERLANDLNLQANQIPGISSICLALTSLELNRKKIIRVAQERFTAENLQRRNVYNTWKHTVNIQDVYFLDETGFQANTDLRKTGRSFRNERIPLVTLKNFGVPKSVADLGKILTGF